MLSNLNTKIQILCESKKIEILSRHLNVKRKIALNIICQRKYTILFSTLFGVYTPTQYALSCKKRKLKIYANRKISNYLGTAMLKEKLL